ncbi:NAP family [Aspergillus sclerotialis]|uniref:NAP family n=1 Tax=Aspergillus sclerotialis TaxID=2070753 RepID=A0A3A2ZDM1_9EURO|nr:NAP family [Aspergillus sclerotialis]
MADQGKSLEERIEFPSIPKEAAKKIARLEEEFTRTEVDQLRKSVPVFRPIFEKRNEIITSPEVADDFWIRVFSNAPAEIDEYILPTDAGVLGSCLKNLRVERFEVDEQGNGEPRSVRFIFDFKTGEDNPFFENASLVKEFYWRKQIAKNSKGKRRTWEGLVSEPVRINWKKDMDLTKGLLDAACDLAEAEKKNKGKDRKTLPEFEKLVKRVEEIENERVKAEEKEDDEEDEEIGLGAQSPAGVSLFAFFGYRGRDVTAEQSKEAAKEDDERWAKIVKGEKVDDEDQEDDDEDEDYELDELDLDDIEIFPDGEELAIAIAEDLWPGALKYYVQSYELADDLDEMEDMDEDMDDDDDEEESSRPHKKARV